MNSYKSNKTRAVLFEEAVEQMKADNLLTFVTVPDDLKDSFLHYNVKAVKPRKGILTLSYNQHEFDVPIPKEPVPDFSMDIFNNLDPSKHYTIYRNQILVLF